MSASDVILYRYDISSRSKKVDNILLFKEIKHSIVNVAPLPPRPEISELLGVTYRQIPILAIGNDVYCDSYLIVPTLERRFPDSKSIFSARKDGSTSDTGIIKVFSRDFVDMLARNAGGLMPWDNYPKEVVEDRVKHFGANPEAAKAAWPHTRSQLLSQLALLEEQLIDGRQWLFDTQEPTLADISVHYALNIGSKSVGDSVHLNQDKLPYLVKWFSQIDNHLNSLKTEFGAPDKLNGDAASKVIASGKWEDYSVVGFDAGDLGVQAGDIVSVASTSIRFHNPTIGKLVALNTEEVVIEVNGKSGTIRCHFPRYGYVIKPEKAGS